MLNHEEARELQGIIGSVIQALDKVDGAGLPGSLRSELARARELTGELVAHGAVDLADRWRERADRSDPPDAQPVSERARIVGMTLRRCADELQRQSDTD